MNKKLKTLWQSLIMAVFLVSFIVGAFVYGTYHPNKVSLTNLSNKIYEQELEKIAFLNLKEPEFEYSDSDSFVIAVGKCVDFINFHTNRKDRIPTSIIIAMAGIETGWGTSRFAVEGNNLFGVRTWNLDLPHMKPLAIPDAKFGIRKYPTKCDSVRDMIDILNNHPAYADFRITRDLQVKDGKWNYKKLLEGISAWSINEDYSKIISKAIVDRNLP